MIVSVQNQKGGVGKTATAVGLAAAAREAGLRVLLIDLDPQASASRWLEVAPDGGRTLGLSDLLDGHESGEVTLASAAVEARAAEPESEDRPERPALDVLAADEALLLVERELGGDGVTDRLRSVLAEAEGRYDLVVLDGGPAITALSANALYAADLVVAPVTLSSVALDGVVRLRQLVALANERGHALRALYLPTAADARLRETRELLGVMREAFGAFPDGDVLEPVRYSSAVSRAYGTRQTIPEYAASARDEAGRADPAAERAEADFGALLAAVLGAGGWEGHPARDRESKTPSD